MKLTARQTEVLDFVRRFRDEHGYAPTVREIARRLKVNLAAVQGHLDALERKKAITRVRGIPRTIQVSTPVH